jgi:hypothetical protein
MVDFAATTGLEIQLNTGTQSSPAGIDLSFSRGALSVLSATRQP